jgi:hypothetical protein
MRHFSQVIAPTSAAFYRIICFPITKDTNNVKLNDLYSSPSIVRVRKSRRMRWAGHVVHMGERRGIYKVLVENREEKRPLREPGLDERIILRWIFRKWVVGTGLSWLRIATGGGHLWVRCGTFGFYNAGNFLTSCKVTG